MAALIKVVGTKRLALEALKITDKTTPSKGGYVTNYVTKPDVTVPQNPQVIDSNW